MNILIVNKYLFPKGGSETYVLKLGKALADKGHQVQYFGMASEKNTVGNRVGAYVSEIDFNRGIRGNLTAPFRIIYNREARRKIRQVLEDFRPDVVHLNNIQFHLTPSIILEIEKYRRHTGRSVRIVYTAHDYQLVCPSHGLFDGNLRICERCLGGNYTHCLRTKCHKHSRAKSLLAMLDAYCWKLSKAYSYMDIIICCSRFLKSKLDTQPRFREKTVAMCNFMDEITPPEVEKEGYVLEFGHLSRDKGTNTLLEVARRMPETRFVFAGFGASVEQIRQVENAEYVGFQTGEALKMLIAKAAVSVCPSEIYENCPFAVIESQMYATPVVGARIGGIPELIDEGSSGELFEPGNPDELEAKLRKLLSDPERLNRYTENCKTRKFMTTDAYYERLMCIYGIYQEDL